jgi:hypothetical protein
MEVEVHTLPMRRTNTDGWQATRSRPRPIRAAIATSVLVGTAAIAVVTTGDEDAASNDATIDGPVRSNSLDDTPSWIVDLKGGGELIVIRLTAVAAGRELGPEEEPAWQPVVVLLATTGQISQLREAEADDGLDHRFDEIVASMPAGWPATEVMRKVNANRRGDTADRARLRRAAELMPAGWPATDVMRRAADEPTHAETTIGALQRAYSDLDAGLAAQLGGVWRVTPLVD